MSTRTNIPDPYRELPVRERVPVTCYISPDAHAAVHIRLLGRTPGALNAVLAVMFDKFHSECVTRGLCTAAGWDPGSEAAVADLLTRLNFGPPPERKPKVAKPKAIKS